MDDVAVTGRLLWSLSRWWAVCGLALGVAAFVPVEIGGVTGQVLVTLLSSGFAWGLAGIVAGYAAGRPKDAPIAAAVVLAVATIAYYLLILVVSRRWALGTTEDGRSAARLGLESVARTSGFWLIASILGGVVLGCLGFVIRNASATYGSVAAGVAFGLLAGDGLYQFIYNEPWRSLSDGFRRGVFVTAVASICLACAAAVVMVVRRDGAKAWWTFGVTAAAAGAFGAMLWNLIDTVTTGLI